MEITTTEVVRRSSTYKVYESLERYRCGDGPVQVQQAFRTNLYFHPEYGVCFLEFENSEEAVISTSDWNYAYARSRQEHKMYTIETDEYYIAICDEDGKPYHKSDMSILHKVVNGNLVSVLIHEDYVDDYSYIDGEYYTNRARDRAGFVWCEDIDEYRHENECYYSDVSELWYFYSSNLPVEEDDISDTGYELISYGNAPDVDLSNDYRYKVGFEVEKCDEDDLMDMLTERGMTVGEIYSDLSIALESDSSLNDSDTNGFEAVFPILPLNEVGSKFLEHDFVKDIANFRVNSSCGGHITLSDYNQSGVELLDSIRGYLPIIVSMYRHRANRSYCRVKSMQQCIDDREKYQFVRIQSNRIELRIVSGVSSHRNLVNRFDMCVYMMHNQHKSYMELIKDIILGEGFGEIIRKMYTDEAMLMRMLSASVGFYSQLFETSSYVNLEELINNLKINKQLCVSQS